MRINIRCDNPTVQPWPGRFLDNYGSALSCDSVMGPSCSCAVLAITSERFVLRHKLSKAQSRSRMQQVGGVRIQATRELICAVQDKLQFVQVKFHNCGLVVPEYCFNCWRHCRVPFQY